ncbi:MAG: DUF4185 domain-containing protein [Tenericutes bacterium]|nr:DUF4185 domain-containing protein [Mycoplasmatota bacterium]
MREFAQLLALVFLAIFLFGCQEAETTEETTQILTEENISECVYQISDTYGDEIVIQEIDIPYSEVLTNSFNFICPSDDSGNHELIVSKSQLKTHQIYLSFDAIYPLGYVDILNYVGELADSVTTVTIELSIDGISYDRVYYNYDLTTGENRIDMENKMAKAVKLIIPSNETSSGIQDLNFILGEGYIVREETELTNKFFRNNGWTGADGVFTFDLDNGGDTIGLAHETTGFIFSDTFIGDVDDSLLRINFDMINNTFGYLSDTTGEITYAWDDSSEEPKSVLLPDAYIGQRARNLLDGEGLTITNSPAATLNNSAEGTMWLSDDLNSELVIDLQAQYAVPNIYLWNYNANPDYGVKAFDLYTSLDGIIFSYQSSHTMDKASGSESENYSYEMTFNELPTRYLKIVVTDTFSEEFVGLGKIMMFGLNGQALFGEVTASKELTEITTNEESARLWLQDGIVIGDKIYIFPILVKDYETLFKVFNVGLIEMDIVNKQFDYETANYLNTPLMCETEDGGVIYYGAGVMDNRDIDGYIYVYGYKDGPGRKLVVARVTEENFLNFNEWTYYDGENWSKKIEESAVLIAGVSPELSVTYMNAGTFAGKYMLVVMENTNSGNIAFSLSDSPFGPFSEYTTVYETAESGYLTSAFTYNAKLHPNLSTSEKLIISYNVNTTNIFALRDAKIYYPRFISITEVKKEEE